MAPSAVDQRGPRSVEGRADKDEVLDIQVEGIEHIVGFDSVEGAGLGHSPLAIHRGSPHFLLVRRAEIDASLGEGELARW